LVRWFADSGVDVVDRVDTSGLDVVVGVAPHRKRAEDHPEIWGIGADVNDGVE
jgi:hypothetical protein